MKEFKDNTGEAWSLRLNLGTVYKLHEKLGLDLCVHSHLLRVISSLTDRMAFVFCLCESQAKDRGVDADEFEDRIQGCLHTASVAFCEEVADFFRRSAEPELIALQRLVVKHVECMKNGRKSISELIESGLYDSQLDEAVAKGQAELDQRMSGEPSPT